MDTPALAPGDGEGGGLGAWPGGAECVCKVVSGLLVLECVLVPGDMGFPLMPLILSARLPQWP